MEIRKKVTPIFCGFILDCYRKLAGKWKNLTNLVSSNGRDIKRRKDQLLG